MIQQSKLLKASSIFLVIFFVFLLHFNAARTGIIAFYLCLFVYALKFIFQQKKVILGVGLMLFLFAIPTLAYFTIDTFKNKIHYTIWDLKQTANTEVIKNYSDSKRIIGYKVAKDAFMEKPIFGQGTGDVRNALQKFTDKTYQKKVDVGELFASNQFLYFAVALGVFGLLIFLFLLTKIYPIQMLLKNDLLLTAGIINLVAMLPENILEVQYGIMVFCLFTVLAHCYFLQKKKEALH